MMLDGRDTVVASTMTAMFKDVMAGSPSKLVLSPFITNNLSNRFPFIGESSLQLPQLLVGWSKEAFVRLFELLSSSVLSEIAVTSAPVSSLISVSFPHRCTLSSP